MTDDDTGKSPSAHLVRAALADPEIKFVAQNMMAMGVHPREVARMAAYAGHFGLDALVSELGGVEVQGFAQPTCGDVNCIEPEHQIVRRSDQRS